ncbi:MAG: peptidoglycan endopeptidase [Bauldia sp.]
MLDRAAFINRLLGRPYKSGANGPEAFDCYGLTRLLQRTFFDRDMPAFTMPREAGRIAIASAIAMHEERHRWFPIARPIDGAIAVMSRQDCGFHMGTYLDLDGGVVVHALDVPGVCADAPFQLTTPAGGRWHVAWNGFAPDLAAAMRSAA